MSSFANEKDSDKSNGIINGKGENLMLILVGIAAITIIFSILITQGAITKPFYTINSNAVSIQYYRGTVDTPTITIRTTLNNEPVPFTVSLFAITPFKVYTVGYYYGYGSVNINMINAIIEKAARLNVRYYKNLYAENGVMPSLLAIITYVGGNKSRTIITAIPYQPDWVLNYEPIQISISINLNYAKPMQFKVASNANVSSVTFMSSVEGINDYYGYGYMGNCMGNANTTIQYPTGTKFTTYFWILKNCQEVIEVEPLLFIGWSANVINPNMSGVKFIEVILMGSIQSGSGFYGIYDITSSSGSTLEPSWAPSIQLTQNYQLMLPFINNMFTGALFIRYGEPGYNISAGAINYYDNGNGFVSIGLRYYASLITLQLYENNNGHITPTNEQIYGMNPQALMDIGGLNLYLNSTLDTGKGPITAMFSSMLQYYEKYGRLPVRLLDGATIIYELSTNTIRIANPCVNAPLYGSPEFAIEYTFFIYSFIPVGIITYINGLTFNGVPIWPSLFKTLFTYISPVNSKINLQCSVFINYNNITNSRYRELHITFIGLQSSRPIAASSIYPVGMIINVTMYYPGIYSCQT